MLKSINLFYNCKISNLEVDYTSCEQEQEQKLQEQKRGTEKTYNLKILFL